MAQIFKGRVYGNTPYPSAEINYEYTRDGANMKYRFTGRVYLESSGGWYYNNLQLKLYLNSSHIYTKDCKSSSKGWSIDFDSGWHTVTNKTSGTTPFYFTVKDTQDSTWCNYTSSTYNLTVAPAYTSITKFNVNKRDETSVFFDWSASDVCDSACYSLDNGANWHGLPTSNIVSGLSANTTYNFKLSVRRQDSQLWTESGLVSQTTYDYPHCTSAPNFKIGDNLTLKFYNPLNRTINVQMWSYATRSFMCDLFSTSGESYTGFSNIANNLYASIPNSKEAQYTIDVYYDNNKAVKEGGYYSIKETEIPTFNNFTYKDSSNVANITGNNQVLVKGISTLEVTISSANKMVANYYANPKNYVMDINGVSKTIDYSTSDIITNMGAVTSSGTKRLTIRAYDSRTLSKSIYKDITVYDYSKPVINLDISRLNNFENQTTLKVSGTYTRLNISGADKNTITNVQYRYRETGGSWSNWTTLNTTVSSGKFTCSDVILSLDNTKSFDFEIQAVDKLQTNTASKKLDIGQAILFISSNKKACYINGQQIIMYNVVKEW